MISWFEKLVGKENISDEIVDREVYSTDASQVKGNARKVIWVNNEEQIQQIIVYARRNKLDIVPRGAGTNLVGAVVPFNSIVIDFTKMNKLIIQKDHVIVEPGVILDEINSRLDDKFFPIIPENSSVCTIGGMCGINSAGLYSIRYGRMKEWVIGVDMIDGRGKIKKCGNEVIGMEGILGIITKVKLKLADKVIERSMDLFKFNKIEELIERLVGLKSYKNIIAIEFISASAAVIAGLEARHHVIIEYDSLDGEIKDYNEIERIWKIRKGLFKKLAEKGFVYLEDPLLPIENLAELILWLEHKGIPSFGPIGIGVIYPCFDEREDIKEFYKFIKELNCKVGNLFGYGILKKDFLDKNQRERLIKLKEEFDPNQIMNKNKVI